MNGVTIRTREPADVAEAAAALVEVHSLDGYPVEGVGEPGVWLTPSTSIVAWVAEMGGQIVGHVAISRPDGEPAVALLREQEPGVCGGDITLLTRLFVRPVARGHGAGECLVREVVKYANSRGLRLVLEVMSKDVAAIRLYERLGWRLLGAAAHDFGGVESEPAFCYVAPPAGAAV